MTGRVRAFIAALALGVVVTTAACATGVDDIEGWRKAVSRNYPCAELLDIARGLPDDVDSKEVERDLTRLGCRPQRSADSVNWATRTITLAVPSDWAVQFCEGEGPFLCIARGGQHVGGVELLGFEPPQQPLETWAEAHYRGVQDDRSQACPSGYRIDPDRVAPAKLAGKRGVRVSFTGRLSNGRATERSVTYAAVIDGSFFLIAAHAYDPDGCTGTEGGDFTVEALRAFEPILARIAQASIGLGSPVRAAQRAHLGATS